ncbi:MAG: SDR family NAD(P)-dependent oxidoreductase [Phycisphaeraceae bacterium]
MKRDLRDRVIAITGASSGIGAATAVACAKAGMHVAVAARREERLREVARRIEQLGRKALVVRCDVQRDDDVDRLFDRTVNELGRLDAVFANAGYGIFASVVETSDQQIRDLFETNFYGTVRCIRAAANYMASHGGGHILICSSAASEIGIPMYGYYAATKAAQDSIAGAMRAELYGKGINVTSVHPIGTQTEFFEAVTTQSPGRDERRLTLNTPRALMHRPEKVARAVVRCLRRPRAEVWPSVTTRWGAAMFTALPGVGAWAVRRILKRRQRDIQSSHP